MLTPAGNWALKSSCPDGSNSEKYGSEPQPTNRFPSAVVWALPCDAADRPSGWSSAATSVATPRLLVELHRDRAAVRKLGHAGRLVVEERVDVVPERLGIVLPGEDLARVVECLAGRGCQREAARLAAELPEDLARVAVDLVGRPGVAGVDQQVVAVRVDVYGVDVEPVPRRARRRRAAAARSGCTGRGRRCSTGRAPCPSRCRSPGRRR